MEKFTIDPSDCLILKAFKDSKSLREAAQLLNCDPAGLARKVQYISSEYGFLQKVNNRWQVTSRGLDLVIWIETSIQTQKKILTARSSLRIASTMWFSEEILIPNLKNLIKVLPADTSLALSSPQKDFELSLLDGSVDFVIVCHPPESPEIEHKQIAKEKWVLIAPTSWKKDFKTKEEILSLLKNRPFIRHSDINVNLFLPDMAELTESGVSINNLIGVRSAVTEGLGWSLVPKVLVGRHIEKNDLIEVPYLIPINDRNICLWWLRSRADSRKHAGKLSSWLKETNT